MRQPIRAMSHECRIAGTELGPVTHVEVVHHAPQGMCLSLGSFAAKLVQLGAEDVAHEAKTLCGRDCSFRIRHSHQHLRQQPLFASRALHRRQERHLELEGPFDQLQNLLLVGQHAAGCDSVHLAVHATKHLVCCVSRNLRVLQEVVIKSPFLWIQLLAGTSNLNRNLATPEKNHDQATNWQVLAALEVAGDTQLVRIYLSFKLSLVNLFILCRIPCVLPITSSTSS